MSGISLGLIKIGIMLVGMALAMVVDGIMGGGER